MTDIIDYLKWRGDLPFSLLPVNPVDALIFSALAYIKTLGNDDEMRRVLARELI